VGFSAAFHPADLVTVINMEACVDAVQVKPDSSEQKKESKAKPWVIRAFFVLLYASIYFLFEPDAGYESHVVFHASVAAGVGYCLLRALKELREIKRQSGSDTDFWSQVVKCGFWAGFLLYAAGDLLENFSPFIAWLNDYKFFPETLVGAYVLSILIKEMNPSKRPPEPKSNKKPKRRAQSSET
jgi:hypothetical protein